MTMNKRIGLLTAVLILGVCPFSFAQTYLPPGVSVLGTPHGGGNTSTGHIHRRGQDSYVSTDNGPANASGFLVLGVASEPQGIPISGAVLYINLNQPYFTLPAATNHLGNVQTIYSLRDVRSGTRYYAQYIWVGNNLNLSSSDALDITVQNPLSIDPQTCRFNQDYIDSSNNGNQAILRINAGTEARYPQHMGGGCLNFWTLFKESSSGYTFGINPPFVVLDGTAELTIRYQDNGGMVNVGGYSVPEDKLRIGANPNDRTNPASAALANFLIDPVLDLVKAPINQLFGYQLTHTGLDPDRRTGRANVYLMNPVDTPRLTEVELELLDGPSSASFGYLRGKRTYIKNGTNTSTPSIGRVQKLDFDFRYGPVPFSYELTPPGQIGYWGQDEQSDRGHRFDQAISYFYFNSAVKYFEDRFGFRFPNTSDYLLVAGMYDDHPRTFNWSGSYWAFMEVPLIGYPNIYRSGRNAYGEVAKAVQAVYQPWTTNLNTTDPSYYDKLGLIHAYAEYFEAAATNQPQDRYYDFSARNISSYGLWNNQRWCGRNRQQIAFVIASTWWNLRMLLGAEVTDRIVYEAMKNITYSGCATDSALDATIAADQTLYQGTYSNLIRTVFGNHGIYDNQCLSFCQLTSYARVFGPVNVGPSSSYEAYGNFSGVVLNPNTNTLFAVDDHQFMVEFNKDTGAVIRRILITGLGFLEGPEAITYIDGNRFAITTLNKIAVFDMPAGNTIDVSQMTRYYLGLTNVDLEGLAYDPRNGKFYVAHRGDLGTPVTIYEVTLPTTGITAAARVMLSQSQGNIGGCEWLNSLAIRPDNGNLILLCSRPNREIIELSRRGEILERFSIAELPGVAEGIDFDPQTREMYLVAEGDIVNPQPGIRCGDGVCSRTNVGTVCNGSPCPLEDYTNCPQDCGPRDCPSTNIMTCITTARPYCYRDDCHPEATSCRILNGTQHCIYIGCGDGYCTSAESSNRTCPVDCDPPANRHGPSKYSKHGFQF